jgi:hypothetical protein
MATNIEQICNLLYKEIDSKFKNKPLDVDLEFSDNLAEIIEKLIILHIRVWKMEDSVNQTTNDSEIADLKRKIDFCFKNKRPKLIKALNILLDVYVTENRKFSEENVKLYKGFSN